MPLDKHFLFVFTSAWEAYSKQTSSSKANLDLWLFSLPFHSNAQQENYSIKKYFLFDKRDYTNEKIVGGIAPLLLVNICVNI